MAGTHQRGEQLPLSGQVAETTNTTKTKNRNEKNRNKKMYEPTMSKIDFL
jgi:hypothetical protein